MLIYRLGRIFRCPPAEVETMTIDEALLWANLDTYSAYMDNLNIKNAEKKRRG